MGRNYRFFANLQVQMRRKCSRELDQWKARNEAVATSQVNKEAKVADPSAATIPVTAEDKELAEVTRFNNLLQC